MATQVQFSEWMSKGFEIYKKNAGVLILASLIAVLLSAVTFGVLAGPLTAGLILMVMKMTDEKEKPSAGDIFKGFDFFLQSFLFCLVWGVIAFVGMTVLSFIPCLGQILLPVAAIALGCLLMFAMILIVDRNMEFWPASMASMNMVKDTFWPFLGFFAVASILGSVGSIACGIGVIVTMPITYCMLVVAYREVTSQATEPPPAVTEPTPAEPPASEPPAEPPTTEAAG